METRQRHFAAPPPNPSHIKTSINLPVESISWESIQIWLGYLNEREGSKNAAKKYRLPTEAEWEYAARGGVHWTDNFLYSGSDSINQVAWHMSNSSWTSHDAGTKMANQLGIYDMSGNVWEWCQDWYGSYSGTPQTNPTGPTSGWNRVLRGGAYFNSAASGNFRVAFRNYGDQKSWKMNLVGFRIVLEQ